MCGIGGIINFSNEKVETALLQNMASLMQERGPDNSGLWVNQPVGLVHTRLSIIDLDPRSHQPMTISNENIIIVLNGEIYNYQLIRNELIKLGVSFTTTSDTEVIIQGYHVWGLDKLLGKLNGMFAFCIYDKSLGKAFLVRDFFGKKPIYYLANKETLIFASDIRAIWQQKKDSLTLNYDSIDYFLTELTVPQPLTIWKEIRQVPPSNYLEIDINTSQTTLKKYWELGTYSRSSSDITMNEALEGTERLLTQSIIRRTVSDVPIGCFLSGGVDSGLVVSLLAQNQKEALNTFSVGLNYEEMNELPDARLLAERYGTNHHEIVLEADIIKDFPNLINYYGEPFADSSMLPSYYVTKAIGKDLKVALSGDGGDELFGGYDDYGIAFRTDQYLNKYPRRLSRKYRTILDKVLSRFEHNRENLGSYDHYASIKGANRLYRQMGFSFEEKKNLYHKEGSLSGNTFSCDYLNDVWNHHLEKTLTNTLLKSSLKTRLLNDYLVKVDRASMFNSLEVRSPFLDRELAEWAFSLPNEYKFHNGHNKFLLKKLGEKHIDKNIFNREKRGFGIPVQKWLQNEMHEWMKEILLSPGFVNRGLFDQSYIKRLIQEHQDRGNHTHRLWALICLELWFHQFVD